MRGIPVPHSTLTAPAIVRLWFWPERTTTHVCPESGYALDSRRPHTLWSATAVTAPSRGHRAAVVGPIAAAHCAPRGDGSG